MTVVAIKVFIYSWCIQIRTQQMLVLHLLCFSVLISILGISDTEVNKTNLLLPPWAYILMVKIEKNQMELSNKASYCKSS